MFRIIPITFFCVFLNAIYSFGQEDPENTAFVARSLINAKNLYERYIGPQAGIFNGTDYVDYDNRINGHPYFESEYHSIGTINYFNQEYDSVFFKYDIHKNLVVVEYYDHAGLGKDLALLTDHVNGFTVQGHEFIKIDKDSNYPSLKEGLYDNLFTSDSLQILVSRKKILNEEISGLIMKREFLLNDKYFILKDSSVNRVYNKRSVLKTLGDHKKELQKFIRQYAINFKSNFENSLLKTTKFYSNL